MVSDKCIHCGKTVSSRQHRRLNGHAGRGDLAFYVLLPLLLEEAATVEQQMIFVLENLLNRRERSVCASIHGRIFQLWDKCEDGDISTAKFLKLCTTISGIGPTPATATKYRE